MLGRRDSLESTDVWIPGLELAIRYRRLLTSHSLKGTLHGGAVLMEL